MIANKISQYCLTKTGAFQDHPFGPIPICFKVGKRIFLEWYPEEEKITVRCEPMLADFYRREYPGIVFVGYHCPDLQKPYKNTIYLNKGLSQELIFDMIDHSYEEAFKRLTKKEQAAIRSGTN